MSLTLAAFPSAHLADLVTPPARGGPTASAERTPSRANRAQLTASDETLVKRALEGETAARRQLAGKLLSGIQREVAYCLTRAASSSNRDGRQEVCDMVQDVLVSLFEHDGRELRRWDPQRGRSLDSFVRLVARRRVARVLGQRRGNPWAQAPVDPEVLDETPQEPLLRRLEERDQLDQVLVALAGRMSLRDHELFDLLFVREVEPDEAARQMDMTRGAVNAWSYRVRKLARSIAKSLDAQPPTSDRARASLQRPRS